MSFTFSHKVESFADRGDTYYLHLRIECQVHLGHQCSAPDLEDDPTEVDLLDVRVEDAELWVDGERRPLGDAADGTILPRLTEAVNVEIEAVDAFREAIEQACIDAAESRASDPD
jgi:hypothetical protein